MPVVREMRPKTDSSRVIRVVTWNIHKGIGGIDRRYRPERIIEVLQRIDADVALLQEVDEGARRSRRDRQVDLIGDALGLKHRAYYPNHRLREGHYGNAVLSRLRFDHWENIDLTIPLKKQRGALHVRMSIDMGARHIRLWLFNVHLGLAQFERRRQLQKLLKWQRIHHRHADMGVILGGDFNDVGGRLGRQILEPEGYQGTNQSIKTFPAWGPLRPLDRVFVHGPICIERAFRSRLKLSRQASDHLPLVVEIRV